ncbi:ferritin-like fold-containing protein [Microlunatus ginsengisoli]|uniref:Ferritin-like domain-containing protein n=1 Tax=Microlunatus ginsengisoli TaxID=363863 RepID=A0ABP7A0A8_9ACTN
MSEAPASATPPSAPTDESYRAGAVDLLGALAYGALTAFERLADDAQKAPTLGDKIHMATMAAQQIAYFDRMRDRLKEFGVDVLVAMRPFHAPFDAFHEYTHPKDWYEGLLKAYVGDGIAADFYREVAAFVDPETRELVYEVLSDHGHDEFVVSQVRAGIEADPKLAGRLALWGRRLVGEALSQAQRVAADRDALTSLLTGTSDRPGLDLAAISRMFSRLVANHTKRMAKLGLQA